MSPNRPPTNLLLMLEGVAISKLLDRDSRNEGFGTTAHCQTHQQQRQQQHLCHPDGRGAEAFLRRVLC